MRAPAPASVVTADATASRAVSLTCPVVCGITERVRALAIEAGASAVDVEPRPHAIAAFRRRRDRNRGVDRDASEAEKGVPHDVGFERELARIGDVRIHAPAAGGIGERGAPIGRRVPARRRPTQTRGAVRCARCARARARRARRRSRSRPVPRAARSSAAARRLLSSRRSVLESARYWWRLIDSESGAGPASRG